jgi:hypothetical protein
MKRLLIIALLILASCSSEKDRREKAWLAICQEKGFYSMTDSLVPELLGTNCSEAIALREKNRFACTRGCEFCFGTLTEDLQLTYVPIKPGFADDAIGELGADENGLMMWAKQGYRGFLAIDTKTKSTLDFIPSVASLYGSGEEVLRAYLTSLSGQVLLFKLSPNEDQTRGYMLYDFANKKDLFIPPLPQKNPIVFDFHRLSDTSYLIESADKSDNFHKCKWYIVDISIEGFINWRENKLTQILTSKSFCAYDGYRYRCLHAGSRMFVGWVDTGARQINSVISWDVNYENVHIEPLTIQCPSEYNFYQDAWTFSLDGHWLVNVAAKINRATGTSSDPQLVFYHVDPKYPQGISLPVFAGTINGKVNGCFVDHTKLGMVFLDIQTGHNATLLYKMSDMLPIIAKKMAQQ